MAMTTTSNNSPPEVFISYSHDSEQHLVRVREFADRLRKDGINCHLDQYVQLPKRGWSVWMARLIRDAEFVLIVCTEKYYRGVMGDEKPKSGQGSIAEGRQIIRAKLEDDSDNERFIPIYFNDGSSSHIPNPLRDDNNYIVDTNEGYEKLYIRLTGQHPSPPPIGRIRQINKSKRNSPNVGNQEMFTKDATVEEIMDKLQPVLERPNLATFQEAETDIQELLRLDVAYRTASISSTINKTVQNSLAKANDAVELFRKWMLDGAVVRVVGAGRAKLAGAIPANRLAHGGARISMLDDTIPMPHSIKGGGIIAVSASGKTRAVLEILAKVYSEKTGITIVGIADKRADEFRKLCDVFIGIDESDVENPLKALADAEEYVCSMLLDALVVAAGKRAGFDDTMWRLGHEDIGPTGPYGALVNSTDYPKF